LNNSYILMAKLDYRPGTADNPQSIGPPTRITSDYDREKLQECLAKLASGVAASRYHYPKSVSTKWDKTS
jgi:hypothetical protein